MALSPIGPPERFYMVCPFSLMCKSNGKAARNVLNHFLTMNGLYCRQTLFTCIDQFMYVMKVIGQKCWMIAVVTEKCQTALA